MKTHLYLLFFASQNLFITAEAPAFSDEGDGRIFYSYYSFHVSFIVRDFLSYFSLVPVGKPVVCVGESLFDNRQNLIWVSLFLITLDVKFWASVDVTDKSATSSEYWLIVKQQ